MKGISIVKLTSRHSTAHIHRGRRLMEKRLLFEEILYPICDSLFVMVTGLSGVQFGL